ncbi:unnamed protein product [Phytomonas sp. Hart1]|nr:unnamed protein product [Phytomonas sp. Hart1]|eukprot:CCW66864.1 unnamed protein product [Phytomonas sp. isolate Hart1]
MVLGVLAGDPGLSRDLARGVDFHVRRAAAFSGLPYREIDEGVRRGVPRYVQLRRTAKLFSFQRLYGAGVALLHRTTGIPVKDLVASIREEAVAYPGIARFHHITRAVALRAKNPGLPTGHIVELPTGLRVNFKTHDVVLNLPAVKNYPIQAYGAELTQMMLGRLFRHFMANNFYQNRAFLTNFVHDSVWMDCHLDVLEECVRDTRRILGDLANYVPDRFPGVRIEIPLKVTAACGMDMASMENIPDDDYSAVYAQKRKSPEEVGALEMPLTPGLELPQEGIMV